MINLLPKSQKQELKKEQIIKVIIIWELFFLIFLVVFLLASLLWKTYFFLILEKSKAQIFEIERKGKIMNAKALEKKVEEFNLIFPKINEILSEKFDILTILIQIFQSRPAGLYFKNLNFQGNEIFLSGFSPDRQSLLKFKENLIKLNFVENINFPPENLLKGSNIDFGLSLKIKQ